MSDQLPQWPFDRPAFPPLPDPTAVRTVAQLRIAVADILRHHDLGVVSAAMREELSTVRMLSRWPGQVDQSTFRRFLEACGAEPSQTHAWVTAWQAVHATLDQKNANLPTPESLRGPEQMQEAVEAMVGATTVGAVAAKMHVVPSVVVQILGGRDRVDADTFGQFALACGVPAADVGSWVDARRRVVEAQFRRQELVTATVTAGHRSAVIDAPVLPAQRRAQPDPSMADSYEGLLCALRTLQATVGASTTDIESSSNGRLSDRRAAAILDGVRPASGEDFVLLLRAFGLRDEVHHWVDTWLRLDGATLGRSQSAARRRWSLGSGFASPTAMAITLALIGLLAVILAWPV